jgi:hypothetical protein
MTPKILVVVALVEKRFVEEAILAAKKVVEAFVAKRLVVEAVVAKKVVVVAFVEVEFLAVKSWREEEAETRRLPRVPSPVTESVPVAVRLAAVRLSLKYPLPATESLVKGEVVPMPTFWLVPKKSVEVPESVVPSAA